MDTQNNDLPKTIFGGSPFDLSNVPKVLTELNNILHKNCPNLELRVGMLTELPGELYVYSPKAKGSVLICLYYNGNCIASIQLVINDGYLELRSFTNKTYSGKKYNSLLRYVMVIVVPSIQLHGMPVTKVHSSATNPISAHFLMKHFHSFPIMGEDDNPDFVYFIEKVYKTKREPDDMPALVGRTPYSKREEFDDSMEKRRRSFVDRIDAFYQKYASSNLSIDFEIPLTDELKEKSLRDFTMLANKIECDVDKTMGRRTISIHRSKSPSRSRSKSRSKSPSRSRSKSRSKSPSRSRSKSRSKSRHK